MARKYPTSSAGPKTAAQKGLTGGPRGYRSTARRSGGGGGIDLGRFASEVSRNYARGVSRVGSFLDRNAGIVSQSRQKSRGVPSTTQSQKNNNALRKALGR